ncbi:agglutinin biogenesis protein MshP [Massilia horti]|uniref:Agglutinin biogenesis protein MshP n=1 Tax=Massilia horti TaxID=2562153 RepID=A0A4Y9T052_9BURK|nr:agglutinin biogenesis protein MshP [Massilia horti]TFW30983.1 agglutinin biogenesis protein MshP [Massilia horti]
MTRAIFSAPRLRKCAGVGLITAIFLLVVLAGLGVAMVTIFNAQQQSSSLDVQGARAYQAARAGIEWGLFQQLRNNSCADSVTFAFPDSPSLSGFVVTVTCRATGGALTRWVIEATACNQPGADGTCPNPATNSPDYVARKVEVEI